MGRPTFARDELQHIGPIGLHMTSVIMNPAQGRIQEFWKGGRIPHANAEGAEKMKSFFCAKGAKN